jgi:kinesin family protein 2/24
MGNEQSIVRNVDKRTARREQAQHFVPAIRAFKMEHNDGVPVDVVCSSDGNQRQSAGGGMRVCVRKRPIFPHELSQGEYDVVTCLLRGGTAQVVVHDARMHSDMRHMFINHHSFSFDAVFGEAASNHAVYLEAASPLVGRAVNDGVTATIMMYGQTGSGKTYTMSAIYDMVSQDIFEAISVAPGTPLTVSVSFVELSGDKCADMLNRGKQVQLLTGRDGAVHPYPLAEVTVHNANELLCFIRLACALRATEATGVHNHSSRSHAVCRIFIDHGGGKEGILQLIDLAGSEHRIDSAEHDAARRKEGAQINSSLAALKECVRCKARGKANSAAGSFLPYRKSKLTHLLRACFEDSNPTVVIATVSPSSKDTEHSLNTIRHACIMDGQGTGDLSDATGPKP